MRFRWVDTKSLGDKVVVFPHESDEEVSCKLDWKSVSRVRPAFQYIGEGWPDAENAVPEPYNIMRKRIVVEFRFPIKKAKVYIEAYDSDGLLVFCSVHAASFSDDEYCGLVNTFVDLGPEELCMDRKAWEIQKALIVM